ncbi:MAG: phage head closure protein [Planctomycetaceae bacterium]|nr:phage head closure protein [Planctomycetaceae bacterium]
MNPGSMDRKIEVQVNTPTRDSLGATVESWATLEYLWASVRPVVGTEPFAAQQRYADVSVRFITWYRAGITPLHRIVFDGRTYDIEEVLALPGGRPERLEIRAKARAE